MKFQGSAPSPSPALLAVSPLVPLDQFSGGNCPNGAGITPNPPPWKCWKLLSSSSGKRALEVWEATKEKAQTSISPSFSSGKGAWKSMDVFPYGWAVPVGTRKGKLPARNPFSMEIREHSLLLQLLPYLKSRILWNAESFQAFPELTKSKAFSFPSFVDFSIPKLGFMERSWPADGKIPFSRSLDPPEPWGRWESKQIPN